MPCVGTNSNAKAELLLKERHQLSRDSFVEIRVWRVPSPLRGSRHRLKYRLAHVVSGLCVLRYDNEAGKGDHVHRGTVEAPYSFLFVLDDGTDRLLADFWNEVDAWKP